jgi:hypothetical protein
MTVAYVIRLQRFMYLFGGRHISPYVIYLYKCTYTVLEGFDCLDVYIHM